MMENKHTGALARAVSPQEHLLNTFNDDAEVESMIIDTFYDAEPELVGEYDSPRRDNLFKYSNKMKRHIDHFEKFHAEGDLDFINHHVEWFLNDEFMIYADEYGIDTYRGLRQVINPNGTTTYYPPFKERATNAVRVFIDENGLCKEFIERYEELLVDDNNRIKFLLTLRSAFENSFIENVVIPEGVK